MKAFCTSLLAVLPIAASSADTDRTLENVKGHVTYGASPNPLNALALHTRTALVNHPKGAKADYQFQTTTGQIAVRGTEGAIFSGPQGLQVNVYAVSNPALPVQVTPMSGQVFTLAAGRSLVASVAAGAITASVTSVSQSLFTPPPRG